jgi:hypothetical protein
VLVLDFVLDIVLVLAVEVVVAVGVVVVVELNRQISDSVRYSLRSLSTRS